MDIPVSTESVSIKTRAIALPRHWTDAIPVMLAYLPIAFAFGLSAREAGLSFVATTAMSLFVFAGASQMIAIALFASGQPLSVIVFTVFMVNLRLVLLATSLASYFKGVPLLSRVLMGLQMTDESFALISSRCRQEVTPPAYVFSIQIMAHSSWLTGSILGHLMGDLVFDVRTFGLDFALAGMLIGMIVLLVRTRIQWIVGLSSAVIAVALSTNGLSTYGVLFAAIGGPTLGLWLHRIKEARGARNSAY